MKRFVSVAALGIAALVLQGVVANFVPPPYCPDLGLLCVMAIGLCWRGLALGLIVAAGLGYSADLLSGTLLGQHALLRIIVFLAAFFAGRQLNLRGSLPLVFYAAAMSLIYGAALSLVSTFFVGGVGLSWSWLGQSLQHALINGVVAPGIYGLTSRLVAWADEDSGGRTLSVDAAGRTA